MQLEVSWRPGHPAGYTDDLGIIADENQWVDAELPGWYIYFNEPKRYEVEDWCTDNLRDTWHIRYGMWYETLYISSKRDLTLFLLRWS